MKCIYCDKKITCLVVPSPEPHSGQFWLMHDQDGNEGPIAADCLMAASEADMIDRSFSPVRIKRAL